MNHKGLNSYLNRNFKKTVEGVSQPKDAPFTCPHCQHTWLKLHAALKVVCRGCGSEIDLTVGRVP